MDVNVKVESKIPEYIAALEQAVKEEMESQIRMLLLSAQAECPVDTGKLKKSGKHEIKMPEKGIVQGEVSFSAPYAPKVEAKRHFLYNSYIRSERTIIEAISDRISKL